MNIIVIHADYRFFWFFRIPTINRQVGWLFLFNNYVNEDSPLRSISPFSASPVAENVSVIKEKDEGRKRVINIYAHVNIY